MLEWSIIRWLPAVLAQGNVSGYFRLDELFPHLNQEICSSGKHFRHSTLRNQQRDGGVDGFRNFISQVGHDFRYSLSNI